MKKVQGICIIVNQIGNMIRECRTGVIGFVISVVRHGVKELHASWLVHVSGDSANIPRRCSKGETLSGLVSLAKNTVAMQFLTRLKNGPMGKEILL